ncbi:MAG TPA: PH domain-containing protein [Aliidiomarina sp.]|nr:PH domain-containing protein [Aliidiomarina sp.]
MTKETTQWLRLPPVSLVYFFLKSIQQLVKQGYQMVPSLVAAWVFIEGIRKWVPLLTAAALAVFVLTVILRYLRFSYQVTSVRVQVKQGVLKRSELSLDMDRIQQADIQLPWYLRPFNLRVVRLESAGSKGQEVVLVGLTEQRAVEIQEAVQAVSAQSSGLIESSELAINSVTPSSAADLELRLPLKEVMKIGLMLNPLLIVGLIVSFIFSNSMTRDMMEEWVEHFSGQFEGTLVAVVLLVGVVLGVLLLAVTVSTLFTANTYYNYHLQRFGQRYSYSAGFLSKLTRSFTIRKLQGVVIRQGIIGRILKRFSGELAQAGGVGVKKERFLVPLLTAEQKQYLLADLKIPKDTTWAKVHPWAMTRWLLLPSITIGAFTTIWLCFIAAAALLALNYLGWRKRGWYFDGHWFGTRKGLVGSVERWLPAPKMQNIRWRQGPIQKRLGIGNLRVASASVNYHLRDIREQDALAMQAELIELTRTCNLHWM